MSVTELLERKRLAAKAAYMEYAQSCDYRVFYPDDLFCVPTIKASNMDEYVKKSFDLVGMYDRLTRRFSKG